VAESLQARGARRVGLLCTKMGRRRGEQTDKSGKESHHWISFKTDCQSGFNKDPWGCQFEGVGSLTAP
jgi:hypothetical protein